MDLTYLLMYVFVGLLTAAIYLVRKHFNFWKHRGIPFDEPHPIYGNMRGFRKTRIMQDIFNDFYVKYKGTGPFCGFFFFQRPVALILDTKLAKNILVKDFTNFSNRGVFYNERDDPLTAHLFALDGVKWKQLRQKLTPTFTSGKMKFMFPTVVKVGEQFADVFQDLVKKSNTIEIKELLARFTTDVIGTCAFGIECNSLKDPNAEFRINGRRAFTEFRHHRLIMTFIQSCPKLARALRMRMTVEDVHEFFLKIVRETVEYREKNNIKRSDFMDMLIELKNTKAIKLENGELLTGLTVEEVAAQAFVFFLAGFETSSTTMSFALYELAKHPDVQDKVRKEINEVMAKHNNEFTYECMKELQYMEQVIAETLRMYTIVHSLQREAINDYVVPGNPKFVIEKGMGVIIPDASYHQDPEFYPNPEVFDPDRFTPEMVAKRDSVLWLPFGDGPRNCIGMRFGQMQTRIGLLFLLRSFKFSVCKETQIPMKFDVMNLVLGAEGGIFLRVDKV